MKKLVVPIALALMATAAFAGEFLPAPQDGVEGAYIVTLDASHPATEHAQALAALSGATVGRVYTHSLNGALLTGLNVGQAQALASVPFVLRVEQDAVVSVNAVQNNPPSWGLDRVDQRNLPLDNAYTYNYDGTGVDIFIIDTGARASHNDFGGRMSVDFDSVGDGQNGVDCNGHGTHVAGTAGGATYGVAKNAQLHAVRVLDCAGSGTYAGVVAGVDYVTAQKQGDPNLLAVANMSLGGGASQSLDDAVNNSVAAGVFYAVAAGNNSGNACNYSPARAVDAYTVGSTTSTDARSSFSNYGTCVDIFGPGSSITSAWYTGDTATNTISGTSMASPHVAGAAALVLDELPALSAYEVGDELTARATPGVVGSPGTGSPNLLLYTLSDTVPPPPPPTCTLGQPGDACKKSSDCCSNLCSGQGRNKTCQ